MCTQDENVQEFSGCIMNKVLLFCNNTFSSRTYMCLPRKACKAFETVESVKILLGFFGESILWPPSEILPLKPGAEPLSRT